MLCTLSPVSPSGVLEREGASPVSTSGVLEREGAGPVSPSGVLEREGASPVSPSGVLEREGASSVSSGRVLERGRASPLSPSGVLERGEVDPLVLGEPRDEKKPAPTTLRKTGSKGGPGSVLDQEVPCVTARAWSAPLVKELEMVPDRSMVQGTIQDDPRERGGSRPLVPALSNRITVWEVMAFSHTSQGGV